MLRLSNPRKGQIEMSTFDFVKTMLLLGALIVGGSALLSGCEDDVDEVEVERNDQGQVKEVEVDD